MLAIKFISIFLNILNLSGESQDIILNFNTVIPSLFSFVSNIIGLIWDCFLLRFDLFFWDEIDKRYADMEEPDLYSLSILHFE